MSEITKEAEDIMETAGYITMPAGTLYYRTYEKKYDAQGENRLPVVLLHGNRGTHRDFSRHGYGGCAGDTFDDSYITVLARAGCLVIAMDSRGHGRSVLKMSALKTAVLRAAAGKDRKQPDGSGKNHTAAADMAEDVIRLLDHLKIEKAVILGFSDGANTALEFAADHPDRACKIIAVSANALPDGLISPMLFMEKLRFQWAKALETIKPEGKFGKWCKKEQFLSGLILHSPFLTEERLKKITVPVLLMAGTHDLIKESHTRFIAKCIPKSRLVFIKGGTHQGFFKKKELYIGEILNFLFDEKKLAKTNNFIKKLT